MYLKQLSDLKSEQRRKKAADYIAGSGDQSRTDGQTEKSMRLYTTFSRRVDSE